MEKMLPNVKFQTEETYLNFQAMRAYFDSGATKSYNFRKEQLEKLKKGIKDNEHLIVEALQHDFGKPPFESFISEIGVVYEELKYSLKHLKKWMKPEKFTSPISIQPSSSYLYKEPLGIALIIGPWNYPFQLLISPVIGAIAAGNCVVLKPSEETTHIAAVIEKLIKETFSPEYISVVQGPGHEVVPALMEEHRFNHIFFTGSPAVGAKVAGMAAKDLIPVTLELGGKSPAIVDETANIEVAAKRITWAKFFNAGQTCVCVDYLLVHEAVKDKLITAISKEIKTFYGDDPKSSADYARIVNKKRFNTVTAYLADGKAIVGGEIDESQNYIAPTLLDSVRLDSQVMKEEIFGPILPILTWHDKNEVVRIVRKNRYPLACYVFTKDKTFQKFIIDNIEFGGGCINDAMVHLANPKLPFGGVQTSGSGTYHGKYSFNVFSHKKAVVKSSTFIDPPLRYAPYNQKKMKLARFFMKG